MTSDHEDGSAPRRETGGAQERGSEHDPSEITASIAGTGAAGYGGALLGFLRGWSPDGPWWPTAIPREGGGTDTATVTTPADMTAWADARHGEANLYFHVNDLSPGTRKKGEKGDVTRVRGLHVDIDPRPPVGGWPKSEPSPERLAILAEHCAAEHARIIRLVVDGVGWPSSVPRPTAAVDTGGGCQCFWRLHDDEVVAPELAEALNGVLAALLDGDPAVTDVSRIMRLPGAVNLPSRKKRWRGRADAPTRLALADWTRRFRVADFPAPAAGPAGGGAPVAGNRVSVTAAPAVGLDLNTLPPGVSDRIRAVIVQGEDPDDPGRYASRSEAYWAVICAMVRAGCTDEQMMGVSLDPDFKISGHVLDQPRPRDYAARQVAKARVEAEDPELAEMNALHAFVTYGNKGRVLFEQAGRPPLFIEKQTFLDMYANRLKVVGKDKEGDQIKMPLGKWWFQNAERRQFKGVEFLPGEDAPEGTYNLWRGPAVVPKPGDCGLYLELVRQVIAAGDGVVAEYLFDWMALKVQRPGEKMETSIALRGGQGLGKSVFAENFGSLFGPYFVAVSELKQLTGNFNAHLQHALLVFGDEMAASNNPHLVGRMKTMVTQRHIRIEPKGVDSFEARNHFALILASNNPHIVTTDADDRRYLVLDVAAVRKNDLTFFRDLSAQWQAGGREAFAAFLMARDLSRFEHRRKPRTAADTDLVEISFTGADRNLHDMLRSGETPTVWRDGVPHTAVHDGKTGEVFLNAGDVAQWAQRRGRWTADERAVGGLLLKLSGAEKTVRESVHGKQVRGSWLPPLPEARRRWCALHGRDFDWGEGDGASWDVVRVPGAPERGGDDTPF
jgi:hypothetical protein